MKRVYRQPLFWTAVFLFLENRTKKEIEEIGSGLQIMY